MRTIYNLEYHLLDKLGRVRETHHGGVFSNIDSVDKAKNNLLEKFSSNVAFNVYINDNTIFQ